VADQLSLFEINPGLPDGFRYRPDVLDEGEERALAAEIERLPFKAFEFQYSLRGAARNDYEHSIPGVEQLRYSLTFRNFRWGEQQLTR